MKKAPKICFAVGITPAAKEPSAYAAPKIPAKSGFEPKERGPITVESRFVYKSTAGAKFILMPNTPSSFAI